MDQIYLRDKKEYRKEAEFKADFLNKLYLTTPGRILLKGIIIRPWFSKLIGIFQNSSLSKPLIKPFIKANNLDMSGFDVESFRSFNDFFTRKKNIEDHYHNDNLLLSPADSKISIYEFSDDLVLDIKSSKYTVEELLGKDFKEEFKPKYCVVYRLSVDDYHRYSYIDDGEIILNYKIKGVLHTVRPISSKYRIYQRNSREVTMMKLDNFGKVIAIEVGAVMVGKIVNFPKKNFKRLEERGYFEYGGSTIVMLYEDNVVFDEDLLEQSEMGNEVQVRVGEAIGRLK